MIKIQIRTFVLAAIVSVLHASCSRQQEAAQMSCNATLMTVDDAKEFWAYEHDATNDQTVGWDEILPYLPKRRIPNCPHGGAIELRVIGERPTCDCSEYLSIQKNRQLSD